jgi:N-acetyl-anhydromuramyl-L-alanine amidase AmpD
MTDYAGAIWSPNNNYFPNTGKKSFLILHGTAGGSSAQEIASYFQSTQGSDNPVSSHYIVGQDGTVVQTVRESDGAYGNGVVTNPNWLGNPNYYTLSVEHVKPDDANATALTPAQQAASFALIRDICQRNGIGMFDATDTTGITGHFSIDPVNRSRCPGTFDWNALWAYLQGGTTPVNTQPTANQMQAANDCWNSVLKSTVAGPAPTGTGIYQAWLAALVNGVFYGPPITHEYDTVDWNGNAITVQEFAHARCEWDGSASWYSFTGNIIAH